MVANTPFVPVSDTAIRPALIIGAIPKFAPMTVISEPGGPEVGPTLLISGALRLEISRSTGLVCSESTVSVKETIPAPSIAAGRATLTWSSPANPGAGPAYSRLTGQDFPEVLVTVA